MLVVLLHIGGQFNTEPGDYSTYMTKRLCELGADVTLTETFLSIGIDELSVSPRSVLPLRKKIRETDVSKVKEKVLADLLSDENTI